MPQVRTAAGPFDPALLGQVLMRERLFVLAHEIQRAWHYTHPHEGVLP